MNQSVKLSKAISYVVIACAILVFLTIWPAGIFQQTTVSKSNEIIAMESDPVNVERNVTQMFVAEEGQLSAVDLYVCNDMRGETITFRLYDASYTEIFNTFYVVKDKQEFPGFVHIPVGYDLVKDQEYYFTLEGLSADMVVAYEDRESSTSIVNGFMSYGGIEIQRYNVIIRYEYSNPFPAWAVLLFAVGIAAVTGGLLAFLRFLFAKKVTDRDVKVQNVLRVTLNPIVIAGGLLLCLMVFPGRKFGTGAVNYALYGGGILLLTGLLLYWINYKRDGMDPLIQKDTFISEIPGFLQAICFAGMLWSCYEYMNGLYDIHHHFAVRRMILWFLMGLICTFRKKDLLQIWNLLWITGSAIGCYFYTKPYLGMEEEGGLYKLQADIIVAGGLVILLLLVKCIRIILKKDVVVKKISWWYLILFAVFAGFINVFRNGRDWVLVLTVLFVIFYIRMWTWENSDRILKIFGNGIILNFIYMVGYSLLHRPYHRYYFYRYGLGYHTVTMTGVYLSLVLCAVVVTFLLKYHKTHSLKSSMGELILLGIGNVYLFITLSRTGYLAAGIVEVFLIILFAFTEQKKKWLSMLQSFLTVVAVSVLFFPIVFTMTRIMPALANDPVLSDVEKTGHHITQGTPADSELYMDINRFLKIAGYKVFEINSEDFASTNPDGWEVAEDYFYKAVIKELQRIGDPDGVYVTGDRILLADNSEDIGDQDLNDMTNGRVDIFKEYIKHWNMNGHEDMWVTDESGAVLVHAHNVFLQVIHDHGIPTGIVFILFGVTSLVAAIVCFFRNKDRGHALTIAVLLAFAAAGLAEWNFHLCNPFGPSVFVVVTPLLFKNKDIKSNEQQ